MGISLGVTAGSAYSWDTYTDVEDLHCSDGMGCSLRALRSNANVEEKNNASVVQVATASVSRDCRQTTGPLISATSC